MCLNAVLGVAWLRTAESEFARDGLECRILDDLPAQSADLARRADTKSMRTRELWKSYGDHLR
jgi:hypothetical protein